MTLAITDSRYYGLSLLRTLAITELRTLLVEPKEKKLLF